MIHPLQHTASHDELEQLASAQAAMPRDESRRGWRNRTKFWFTNCRHTSCTLVEVENERGRWGVEICNDCGHQVARECPHEKSEWFADGQVLLCLNCGSDGT
jgi:hypothetical protein